MALLPRTCPLLSRPHPSAARTQPGSACGCPEAPSYDEHPDTLPHCSLHLSRQGWKHIPVLPVYLCSWAGWVSLSQPQRLRQVLLWVRALLLGSPPGLPPCCPQMDDWIKTHLAVTLTDPWAVSSQALVTCDQLLSTYPSECGRLLQVLCFLPHIHNWAGSQPAVSAG